METEDVDGDLGGMDEEPLGELSQAVYESACSSVPADHRLNARVTPQWSYTAMTEERALCTDARVLEVDNFQEGTDVGVTGVTFQWGDLQAATPSECGRQWLGTSVYKLVAVQDDSSGNVQRIYQHVKNVSAYGTWQYCTPGQPCVNFCVAPSVTYYSSVSDNKSYRFVSSALRLDNPSDINTTFQRKKLVIEANVID